jgi:hypothetical protein
MKGFEKMLGKRLAAKRQPPARNRKHEWGVNFFVFTIIGLTLTFFIPVKTSFKNIEGVGNKEDPN